MPPRCPPKSAGLTGPGAGVPGAGAAGPLATGAGVPPFAGAPGGPAGAIVGKGGVSLSVATRGAFLSSRQKTCCGIWPRVPAPGWSSVARSGLAGGRCPFPASGSGRWRCRARCAGFAARLGDRQCVRPAHRSPPPRRMAAVLRPARAAAAVWRGFAVVWLALGPVCFRFPCVFGGVVRRHPLYKWVHGGC